MKELDWSKPGLLRHVGGRKIKDVAVCDKWTHEFLDTPVYVLFEDGFHAWYTLEGKCNNGEDIVIKVAQTEKLVILLIHDTIENHIFSEIIPVKLNSNYSKLLDKYKKDYPSHAILDMFEGEYEISGSEETSYA